jgi:hypothetical protein
MRGSGDHTWVDLEVLTQEQYDEYENLKLTPAKRSQLKIDPLDQEEKKNLKGPFKIIEPEE